MADLEVRSLERADERRPFADRGYADVVSVEGRAVMRGVFEPGWRWSEHVKPIAGTETCQAPHLLYCLGGRMRVRMDDGTEMEFGSGDVVSIAPGHDAWTVGDEACVLVDFGGYSQYAKG